ncbi:UNVERIFIED_CONTAM: hypothetical protein Sangu_2516900 [Sesamum angustifolium]|uniref:Uncharacterized protein n=1 Tax=Sesamum angustifolium TaxID=2727405 RepID=A0AAW2JJK7_9LAMI
MDIVSCARTNLARAILTCSFSVAILNVAFYTFDDRFDGIGHILNGEHEYNGYAQMARDSLG